MASRPLDISNSPLSAEQAEQLNRLLQSLQGDQMTWLSGYLAGLSAGSRDAANTTPAQPEPAARPALTILYGSQTGNSEELAQKAAERARNRGFAVRMADMGEFRKPDLKQAGNLMVVVSTHGDGEPPDNALDLCELVNSRKAPPLNGNRFAVLALGDSSYANFCQTGRDFDARLEALGGERIVARLDCDLDYEDAAEAWIDDTLARFSELTGNRSAAVVTLPSARADQPVWTRKHPFPATVLENIRLTGRGSDKDTRHIELSLEGAGLNFQPGDALGVQVRNDVRYVDELVDALALDGGQRVTEGSTLREALLHDYEVTTITRPFLAQYAELADSSALRGLLAEDAGKALRDYLYGREVIDVVRDYPVRGLAAPDLLGTLRRLPRRLYSIASSLATSPDEVHLTVGVVRYNSHGRERLGVASNYLAGLEEDAVVPVYVDHNKNFKLPGDPATPVIMIGPGTGVAPFRAFLAEREALAAPGRNWLFFGERRFLSDFLYQTDWLQWRKRGLLSRLDVAFSRDQADKVYVQHRLREQARDVYAWLEEGAHVYVCGDADHMAHDVHQALADIVREQGGLSAEAAAGYLKQLQRDKRYQRDVY